MGYIEQAYKGKNEWWRYALSIIMVLIGWQFIGIIPLFIVAFNESDDYAELMASSANAFTDLGIDSNVYLLVMLLMFICGLIFLLFSVKSIHMRSITSLVTSRINISWKRVLYGFSFWFFISVFFLMIDYFMYPDHYVYNFKPVPFAVLVIISFVLMPLQTAFEELLFRGYFMQGLGILFKNAAIPFVVTSVAFGLMHSFNPEVEKLGYLILIYYVATGFLFGMITLMDEGTELALGMHAANNIVAAIFVTMKWAAFQTEALFVDISEPTMGIYLFFPVFVIYPLVILFLSRKYGWSDWRQKLFGKVNGPEEVNE
jgi:membrane protease YdiL (CAAX protease family)